MRNAVFLDYDQAGLDRAYDQRAWAPDWQATLHRLGEDSRRVRAQARCVQDLPYGRHPSQLLDIFPCREARRPIRIHIHGGGWRMPGKDDAAFAAPAITAAGMNYVVPEFSQLPEVHLPIMVDQLARAVAWVYQNATSFDGDPQRIYLSGHSSGAHLCAVLLTLDWSRLGMPSDIVKGAVCISGMYDLAPVLLSARREYVKLTKAQISDLSPARHCARIQCPVRVVYARDESPEFVRQAMDFQRQLLRAERAGELIELPECDHYSILDALPRLVSDQPATTDGLPAGQGDSCRGSQVADGGGAVPRRTG